MVSFSSPRGGEYWFLQPAGIESSDEPGTDTRSIKDGRISISVIAAEPVSATEQPIHDMISWRGI
jgi:broad specificity polyphosphatase/5'/3'-nucleotidase SurE